MSLIIVDGPDGAGKSTLINQIKSRFIVLSAPKSHAKKARNEYLIDYDMMRHEAKDSHTFIRDRSFLIGEYIYPSILNRDPKFSQPELWNMLQIVDPIILYCRLDNKMDMFNNISRELKEHKPTEFTQSVLNQYEKIVDAYDDFMVNAKLAGIKVLKYDWKHHNVDDLKFLFR